jgi:hypothetical protein
MPAHLFQLAKAPTATGEEAKTKSTFGYVRFSD